jgi:hypothetical protein
MMLGHLMEWFYSGIGGIRQVPGSKACEHILIAPEIIGDLTWAETSFQSVHGEISSSWTISDDSYSIKVRIPSNCRATVELPDPDPTKITESGVLLESSESVKSYDITNGRTVCEVSSGEYIFRINLWNPPKNQE